MITEATEILEVMEAAKGAPPLLPGLPASEYPSGALWECSDQAELLYAQRRRFLAEIGFCLVTAEVIDALATQLAGKKVLEAGSGSGWLAARLGERGINIVAADWTDYRTVDRSSKRGYPIREALRLDHHGNAVKKNHRAFPGLHDKWWIGTKR